ncbi:TraM recognition domain-containing protein [bacterium]|nr:TraM recognition domain-containing protein [bacterium]
MARAYKRTDAFEELEVRRDNLIIVAKALTTAAILVVLFSQIFMAPSAVTEFLIAGVLPFASLIAIFAVRTQRKIIELERVQESERRGGKPVLGLPPQRNAIEAELEETRKKKQSMIGRYLVGFELDSGKPLWVSDDEICTHAAVFAKTGVGKTLWLESLMFQQMARGRASGFTFIDAKRDMGTLADIILMAIITGRIEDLIVVDPFDPVCAYNFVFTTQRADVKARKVLRCGLPPTSDQSTTKHYDRLAADAVYRVVRAMESLGLAWSVRDVAVALSAFNFAYPRLRALLHEQGAKQAMIELGHLAGSYRTGKGKLDALTLTDNLRGISSELHSISNSEAGEMFCAPKADLSLTDAILRGKLIYYMLPRLEEAEAAARMVKVFREDLEVSIGEITSNRNYRLEDPHMVIIDEGASTFGPTWANLFELARKGRFALLFGAQSVSGLMDEQMGLSEQFYQRVIANVNLKVIMRLGDNETATEMSEWIGKIHSEKRTYTTGLSSALNSREWTKHVELNKRAAEGMRDGVAVSLDEDDLVSPEELKHEMSAEKGLAWFDLGDGILRKGRALWFNADAPRSWEGREYLQRYESIEADEIGLAEWVDEHILSIEREESEQALESHVEIQGSSVSFVGSQHPFGANNSSPTPATQPVEDKEEKGPFRLNMVGGFRNRHRAVTIVRDRKAQSETESNNTSSESVTSATPQAGNASKKLISERKK